MPRNRTLQEGEQAGVVLKCPQLGTGACVIKGFACPDFCAKCKPTFILGNQGEQFTKCDAQPRCLLARSQIG